MSGSIHLIYDKTLKIIMDVLHIESAAILRVDESQIFLERLLNHGKMDKSSQVIQGKNNLLDEIIKLKEPALISSSIFEDTQIVGVMNEPSYYAFPCLDSHMTVIALILIPVADIESFNIENYALVNVVGQRLSVELEKSRVIKERESLSEFNASILESLDEVTWDYSLIKDRILWFGAINKVFGRPKQEMGYELERFLDRVHASDRAVIEEQIIRNQNAGEKFSFDFQFKNQDEVYSWLRIEGVMLCDQNNNPERVIGVIKNVHKEKMAEIFRIRAMIKAKDGERKRIASEIHDSLGQTLSVARLELDTLLGQYEDEDFKQKVESVSNLISGAINESRAISHDLMPPALVDYGLIPAVETMVNQVNRSSDVEFSFFHNNIKERFEEEFETNIYRICQEGVNNILKHAKATQATVQIIRHPNSVYVSIEDNGVGFNSEGKSRESAGLGLKNMANRAAYLGGKIDFDSNNGSIITIEILI
ncbi:MAG: histidine kinase [Reichenbachiella sp.]|uniref:histidine kinase n=1 Tax=Reichenbachiella sp. TaxID=2184521 RepID=UPI0032656206